MSSKRSTSPPDEIEKSHGAAVNGKRGRAGAGAAAPTNSYGGHHFTLYGVPIGIFSILLALLASMGGFIFGYDTGQISDILLMDDFLERFGEPNGAGGFAFTNVRSGLIVALLSVGTLIGALIGAP